MDGLRYGYTQIEWVCKCMLDHKSNDNIDKDIPKISVHDLDLPNLSSISLNAISDTQAPY